MKSFLFILAISALHFSTFGQTKDEVMKDLKEISNLKEAEKYSKAHPTWLAHIYTISKRDSFQFSEVFTKEMNKEFIYHDHRRNINLAGKIFLKFEEKVFDIQYIYLNGNEISERKIASIRKNIFKKIEKGVSFDSLVSQYSMDGMPNGEMFEIVPGSLLKPIDEECLKHNAGDIFIADVPENNWYYVILKKRDLYPIEFTKFLSVKFQQEDH